MIRTPLTPDFSQFPNAFRPLLTGTAVYDSSCSRAAKVYFIDRDGGYYLKSAPKGTLETEAALTRFLHTHGLAADVLDYRSDELDWLLTTRVPGEDCTFDAYLAQPERLCDLLAELLRSLHEIDPCGCPVPDHRCSYLSRAEENYRNGDYSPRYLPESLRHLTADEAWRIVEDGKHALNADILLHGDYCLPNIMLDNWHFSGFIDLGNGGVGDRHVDLYWGAWSLAYNLKTDRFRERFFDAYGREKIDRDILILVAACETFG